MASSWSAIVGVVKRARRGVAIRKARFTVVFDRHEDGYTVTVPALPGLVTSGRTLAEARRMAQDAIRCHLESLRKDGEPIPSEQEVGVEKLEVELPTA
ncbi:MAG: type II toxin-antitoxin system HicB family antitoxin [Planctomycetes bacterium]|nr:type II toxin-antitoxin system HicB family antitoxin [Planctomycetota bacterium]